MPSRFFHVYMNHIIFILAKLDGLLERIRQDFCLLDFSMCIWITWHYPCEAKWFAREDKTKLLPSRLFHVYMSHIIYILLVKLDDLLERIRHDFSPKTFPCVYEPHNIYSPCEAGWFAREDKIWLFSARLFHVYMSHIIYIMKKADRNKQLRESQMQNTLRTILC